MRGLKAHSKVAIPKPKPNVRLDHRNYGAWYLKPDDWEKRFHRKSKKSVVDQCVHKRESRYPEKILDSKKKDPKPKILAIKPKKEDISAKEGSPPVEEQEIDDEEISQVK